MKAKMKAKMQSFLGVLSVLIAILGIQIFDITLINGVSNKDSVEISRPPEVTIKNDSSNYFNISPMKSDVYRNYAEAYKIPTIKPLEPIGSKMTMVQAETYKIPTLESIGRILASP